MSQLVVFAFKEQTGAEQMRDEESGFGLIDDKPVLPPLQPKGLDQAQARIDSYDAKEQAGPETETEDLWEEF